MTKMNLGMVVFASATLLLAGCGSGSSSSGVAHLSSSTSSSSPAGGGGSSSPESSASNQQKMVAYSQCMRSHGVPNFPDPEFHSGGGVGIRIGGKKGGPSGINPSSPQFQAAQKACQSDLPRPPGAKGGPGGAVSDGGGPGGSGGESGQAVAVP
jgi:hypothetical protein